MAMRRFASACARTASAPAGAGSSTPWYSTLCRAMNSLRTAQNRAAFIGQGVPWLGAPSLP